MKAKLFAVAALAALGLVSPAVATIVTVTYTGVVVDGGTGGIDGSGLFGPPGASLLGDSYTATYVFDTSLGGSIYDQNTPTDFTIYGGLDFPNTVSPSLSASLTIGSTTLSLGPAIQDGGMEICTYPACGGFSLEYNEIYAIDDGLQQQLYALYGGQAIPVATFNFELTSTTPYQSIGWFGPDQLDLLPLTVSVSSAPEPPTWAMMLLGFAGLGYAADRRHRKARPHAAFALS